MTSCLIKDIGKVITGNTPSKNQVEFYDSDDIRFVKPDIISDSRITKIESTNEYISEQARSKARIVGAGTVFVTCIGSIGKIGIAVDGEYAFNQQINAIEPNEKIFPQYLAYCLLYNKNRLADIANAPVVPIINKTQLENFSVNITEDLFKQQEIVGILNRVNNLIELRKIQIVELDNLIKSRFIEMFGDPLDNAMGWQCEMVTGVCTAIFGGGTPSKSHPEYFTGDIPWVSPKDMKSMLLSDSIDHITGNAIAHSTTSIVPINSVLMVVRSGILKHTLPVAINSVPVTINQDMKAFVPNDRVTAEYLMYYFKAIEQDVLSGVRGVTADNIDFKAFLKRLVILPPLKRQEQFTDFVCQVNKLKAAVQKALDEMQLLFDSLMQEYFG